MFPQSYEPEKIITENPPANNPYLVPGAIVVAGLIIAGAVIYTSRAPVGPAGTTEPGNINQPLAITNNLKPVGAGDHLLGNLQAPVKIVEFSDLECPFCKRFHATMQQVMVEYGTKGQVAWVYRHFPLDQLHSKARHEAVASECAGKLAGNDGFWKYVNRLFEITPSNNGLDPAELLNIASYLKLDQKSFVQCLNGNDTTKIDADIADGRAAGALGTPYSIVIGPNGKKYPIEGAQPYEVVKPIIESALVNR